MTTNLLARIPFFTDLPADELDRIMAQLEIVNLKSGEILFREGDPGEGGYRRARDTWEKRYLQDLLDEAGGSVAKAAELAGLHRSTLYEKLARIGLVQGEGEAGKRNGNGHPAR